MSYVVRSPTSRVCHCWGSLQLAVFSCRRRVLIGSPTCLALFSGWLRPEAQLVGILTRGVLIMSVDALGLLCECVCFLALWQLLLSCSTNGKATNLKYMCCASSHM